MALSPTETIIKAQQSINAAFISAFAPVLGVEVEVHFPQSENSVYGQEDNLITYSDNPNISGKCLVTGIFQERFAADGSRDAYATGADVFLYVRSSDAYGSDLVVGADDAVATAGPTGRRVGSSSADLEYTIPRGSKVKVLLKDDHFLVFRVFEVRTIQGIDGVIFQKLKLIPIEAL